jgi:uncharacterized protein
VEILRIVVTGGVGAGKTSFIRTISEIEAVDTDKKATDEIAQLKDKTTVALDFGHLMLPPEVSLYLYGTPGQQRFEFMWDILIQKAQAYILLIDAHRPEGFHHSRQILDFMQQRVQIPYLIGLTHTDCQGVCSKEEVAIALGLVDESTQATFLVINPTDPFSVKEALVMLVERVRASSRE